MPPVPKPGSGSEKIKRGHEMAKGGRSCWVVESTWVINLAYHFYNGIIAKFHLLSGEKMGLHRSVSRSSK